jgi:ketosteroid isomerase-like protein
MRTIVLFLSIAASMFIAGCNPKTATGKDQALADSLLKANVNAYNSGDAQKIADLFTDDALSIGNGKNTWTKDSILAWSKSVVPFIKNFKGYLGPTTITTEMVIMQKYWTFDYTVPGKSMPVKGLSTLVWVKQSDHTWKTVLEHSVFDVKPF